MVLGHRGGGHALARRLVARLEADLHGRRVLRGHASSAGCGSGVPVKSAYVGERGSRTQEVLYPTFVDVQQ